MSQFTTTPSNAAEQQFKAYLNQYEEAHSFEASHGFICAACILPKELSSESLLEALLDTTPSFDNEEDKNLLLGYIRDLSNQIHGVLSSGEAMRLPVGPFIVDKALGPNIIEWCLGFMDAVLMEEAAWYEGQEDVVTELLLPMACVSDVFEDEALDELIENPKQAKQLCEQIPQVMIDLYLLFRQD